MMEFLASPQGQIAGAFWTTNILLAILTGAVAMLGGGYLMMGRIPREEIPKLAAMAGFVLGVLALMAWPSVTLFLLWLLPDAWVRTAMIVMEWTVIVLMFCVVAAMALALPYAKDAFAWRRGKVGEHLVSKRLDKLGYEHLDDQYVGDASDVAQVDHIVKVGGSVLVLETKNIEGKLYPKPDGTLSLYAPDDKNPTTIPDPVKQNERQVRAVTRFMKGLSVQGVVVFTEMAEFPQGLPPGCVRRKDLGAYLRLLRGSCPETADTEATWQALRRALASLDREEMRSRHVEMISGNAAFRSLPRGTLVCRGCHGGNVVIAHGYSYHWHCEDCDKRSAIRVDAGESLLMEGGVLYRVGPRGRAPVEGQAGGPDSVQDVQPPAGPTMAKQITWPKPKPATPGAAPSART